VGVAEKTAGFDARTSERGVGNKVATQPANYGGIEPENETVQFQCAPPSACSCNALQIQAILPQHDGTVKGISG
jgi:hypothetical protein